MRRRGEERKSNRQRRSRNRSHSHGQRGPVRCGVDDDKEGKCGGRSAQCRLKLVRHGKVERVEIGN